MNYTAGGIVLLDTGQYTTPQGLGKYTLLCYPFESKENLKYLEYKIPRQKVLSIISCLKKFENSYVND